MWSRKTECMLNIQDNVINKSKSSNYYKLFAY